MCSVVASQPYVKPRTHHRIRYETRGTPAHGSTPHKRVAAHRADTRRSTDDGRRATSHLPRADESGSFLPQRRAPTRPVARPRMADEVQARPGPGWAKVTADVSKQNAVREAMEHAWAGYTRRGAPGSAAPAAALTPLVRSSASLLLIDASIDRRLACALRRLRAAFGRLLRRCLSTCAAMRVNFFCDAWQARLRTRRTAATVARREQRLRRHGAHHHRVARHAHSHGYILRSSAAHHHARISMALLMKRIIMGGSAHRRRRLPS